MRLLRKTDVGNYMMILLLAMLPAHHVAAEQAKAAGNYKLKKLPKPASAPDFLLKDMDGKLHSLKQYRGKVVLINFWATWCPPCIREMPSMESLFLKFKSRNFVILAINQWEDDERVFEFMGQLKSIPTFPILFDPDSKISSAYGVQGLPSSYIIDKQGRIVYRAKGGRDFDHPDIVRKIKSLF